MRRALVTFPCDVPAFEEIWKAGAGRHPALSLPGRRQGAIHLCAYGCVCETKKQSRRHNSTQDCTICKFLTRQAVVSFTATHPRDFYTADRADYTDPEDLFRVICAICGHTSPYPYLAKCVWCLGNTCREVRQRSRSSFGISLLLGRRPATRP